MDIMHPVAVLGILLLPVGLSAQVTGNQGPPAEREIRSLQERLISAYMHRDLTAVKSILADDYTFVESHGAMLHKADLVQNFGSGDRVLTSYVIDDDQVRIYGDAAVMTYHYRTKERYRGQDQSGDFRMIRVFAHRNNTWQIVAGQETAVIAAPK